MIQLFPQKPKKTWNMIKKIKEEAENVDLFLNIKKTRLMTISRNGNIKKEIDGEEVECVKKLQCLRIADHSNR